MEKKIIRHRLPKGTQLLVQCQAVDYRDDIFEIAETKSELLSIMQERGFDRSDYDIRWIARDMTTEGTLLFNEGIGDTRKEAIEDFWNNYQSK